MTPRPGPPQPALRRLRYAARSLPARPPTAKHPGNLIAGAHSRGYLPHVKTEGGTYFVTFRLADSLPREVTASLHARRLASDQKARSPEARGVAERAHFRAFEEVLDAAHGACWLRRPDVATLVTTSLLHFDHVRYRLNAWIIMPNHVHAVVTPLPGVTLSALLHSWKSFTAKAANALLPEKSSAAFWQRETYDRWCRDEAEIARCVIYVEGNPVKADLCRTAEEWLWSSAASPGRRDACATASEDACAT